MTNPADVDANILTTNVVHASRKGKENSLNVTKRKTSRFKSRSKRVSSNCHPSPVACPICGLVIKYKYNLNRHITNIHGGNKSALVCKAEEIPSAADSSCDTPGKEAGDDTNEDELVSPSRHEANAVIEKKHMCVFCKERFSTATSLDCHMKMHISEKSGSNGQVSFTLSPTQQKVTSTGEENAYHQISLSGKPFHSDRKNHILNEHLVWCKICKKSFSSESSLFTHMRIHATCTYSCPLCERKFIEKDQIEVHMLRHEGKRFFSCSICDMSCIRKEKLQQHLACHAGDNLKNISLHNFFS